jgi:hypothetical protein
VTDPVENAEGGEDAVYMMWCDDFIESDQTLMLSGSHGLLHEARSVTHHATSDAVSLLFDIPNPYNSSVQIRRSA